ncbi:hypothetical protein N9161_03925 [Porticoccaceae bacterium]|nr:hypothetical protein [Porticoccaceae bacterium]
MGSRLLLIFAVAKLLRPDELGSFGLMVAAVAFCVLLLGADYYTYSQRELLSRPYTEWSIVIQNQIRAHLILYVALLPLHILIFVFGFLDWIYVPLFFTLLLFEHIAQEVNRLLIAMHMQLLASVVLFVRSGSWVFVTVPMMYFLENTRNLGTLYTAWIVGCAVAILLGISGIKRALPLWRKEPFDRDLLVKGFKVCALFLVATLCFRGLFTFDRYVLEIFSSKDIVGVYVFYMTLIMGVYNLLEPAIFSFLYPRLLQSYRRNKLEKYNSTFRELAISTMAGCVLLVPVVWVLLPIVVGFLDDPIYAEHADSTVFFIFIGFAYAAGMVPHYALYSMRGDKWIVSAHTSSIVIFLIALEFLDFERGIYLVSVALSLTLLWAGLIKTIGMIIMRNQSEILNADTR